MFRSKKVAIDLGTANTVVMVNGQVELEEPTVVAYDKEDRKILAVGLEAKEMIGKVPDGVIASRPMRSGGIANYRATEALLKRFIHKTIGKGSLVRPEVIISTPAGVTSVEERAVIQALSAAGAGKAFLLPEPIAAAIGAELPIHTSSGNMIMNMGGGTAEIAVLSLNGLVSFQSKRGAGDALNESIQAYTKKRLGIELGELMAEQVKMQIGSAIEMRSPDKMEITGINTRTGMPDSMEIDSNQVYEAMKPVLKDVLLSARKVLQDTPPGLASDIIERGIVLSGGTALLRNFDDLVVKALGVPAYVIDEPLQCVVRGLTYASENTELLRRSMKSI